MLHLKIVSVGKTKESWLNDALDEYVKRLTSSLDITFIWAKDDIQLIKLLENEKNMVCFDESGKTFNSIEFANFLFHKMESGGSRVTFVIGGPEGLPAILKKRSDLISLSRLTLTHQFVRLLLLEQVYRAFEISKGTKYHK